MMSTGLAVLLQISLLAAGADSYAEAHRKASETGQPIVVIVGADWCPACQVMKDRVLPEVRRHGLLSSVAFATVNLDREQELGRELVGGGRIPQLLMYRQTAAGWRLRRLVGGHSVETVEAFISRGIELDERTKRAEAAQPEQADDSTQQVSLAR